MCIRDRAEDGIIIRGIYERSDAKVRLQEGMERFKGFIGETFDTKVEIVENGVHYMVDVEDGQKTGFFLDQKYNRLAIQRLCKDKKVLDYFTHTGSFALNAGIAGASSVLGVDASELGLSLIHISSRRTLPPGLIAAGGHDTLPPGIPRLLRNRKYLIHQGQGLFIRRWT